jgi:hypothetical protein
MAGFLGASARERARLATVHALKEEWAEWALALPEPSLRCLALVEMLEVFVKVRSHSAQRDTRFVKVRSHSAQRDTRFVKVRSHSAQRDTRFAKVRADRALQRPATPEETVSGYHTHY